ncbi:MAG TPA: cytidine deaminase [Terriglobales bacterium]
MTSKRKLDRRTALATMGISGLGLVAFRSEVLYGKPDDQGAPKPLTSLSDKSQLLLAAFLRSPEFSGQIPLATVQQLAALEGKDVSNLMVALLSSARNYSRPPISNYRVGAVARGLSGSLYLGMNVEIPGHSLGFSVHGEQAALSSAYMHGERGVSAISVTAAPCGHCRQFMNEMSLNGDIEIIVEGKSPLKLSSLLPMSFGPKDLGMADGALPVRQTALALLQDSADELTHAALEAARHAYAPYSGSYSGVAIAAKGQRTFKGSYIENAAFNPSLSPLQIALVQLFLAGGDYSAIMRVVLVEMKDAKISQASVTKAVLSTVAPKVELQTVYAVRK